MSDHRPLILVVAMADSIHAARWMQAQRGGPFRVVLVPVSTSGPIPEFGALQQVSNAEEAAALSPEGLGIWSGHPARITAGPPDCMPAPIWLKDRAPLLRGASLVEALDALKPDLLHSLEIQHAGYACLDAAERMGAAFPSWMVSNWGSDLQLYRKLPEHRAVLEALVRRMDAYLGECQRDHRIARELGYLGPLYDTVPASGGADFSALPALSDLPPPSTRREILIKGYHGWSGRALHVLSALHLAAPRFARFRIRVVLAGGAVPDMVAMLRDRDGLDILVDPYRSAHADALSRLASARMTIGMGISDGIGTTTLEAMALGSFPIAGSTACVNEWIRPGTDGFIVDPHDVAGIAGAMVRAAEDDALVDAAAFRNRAEVEARWDRSVNAVRAAALYREILDGQHRGGWRAAAAPPPMVPGRAPR
jgi:hypothetical protein